MSAVTEVPLEVRKLFKGDPDLSSIYTDPDPQPLNTMQWRDLVTQRAALLKAQQSILDGSERQEMNAAQIEAFEFVEGTLRRVQLEMNTRDQLGERGPRNVRAGRMMPKKPDDEASAKDDGLTFRDINTGRIVRAVRHGESFRAALPDIERPRARLGEFMRSLAIGRPTVPELEEEFRALVTTTTGVALPTPFGSMLFDLAREQSMVSQAGALFVPMESKTLQISKVTADPTASWKAEGSDFTASDPTLALVTLTAKTVGILCKASEEVVMDGLDFGSRLEQVMRGAVAAELDRVALVGSGTGAEPGGIMKSGLTANTDVQEYDVDGVPANYDHISRLVQLVRTANFKANALFQHPRDYGTLDRLKDTTNQPLQPPRSYTELAHFPSTRIPIDLDSNGSPNDASIAIAGQFNELLIGVRLNPTVHISRDTTDGTSHAFTRYEFHFRIVARIDVQVARGAAFAVATRIAAAA